jgi:hypothetical protein
MDSKTAKWELMRIQIAQWANLKHISWDSLLIGNGASIALHLGFSYPSLYNVAVMAGSLPNTVPIFQSLGTNDFEYVLLACWHANLVNTALGKPSPVITSAYDEVRDALIAAVNQTHCMPVAINTQLVNVANFASSFKTIVTYNYDLTLYWAMMEFNNANGNWFKDGFINGAFDSQWQRLRQPINSQRTTMVFYAHGSLMLARDIHGNEIKLGGKTNAPGAQTALLNSIIQAWQTGTHTPIFVSEGTATEKLRSIRRSPYLISVYDDVLSQASQIGDSVVVYGLSFSPNDQHVIDALKKSSPKKLAISVFTGVPDAQQQAFCHHISGILAAHLPSTQILFFDSQSSGCWINP